MVRAREVDRPFLFTLDFCLVWAALFLISLYLIPSSKDARSYEHPLASLLFSLFATFLLYGPVLLARQIVRSGRRGRLVARVFLSVLLILLVGGGVFYFIPYTPVDGHVFGFAVGVLATVYLHWRLGSRDDQTI